MSIQSQNKVYESLDVISQEMARKIVHENRHKLSSNNNLNFLQSISPFEENESNEKNNQERNSQKKWTIVTTNIFSNHQNHKTSQNFNKKINKNNPLINMEISSIKQQEEKKDDKNSSFINNIFGNKNTTDKKNFNPSTNPKEKKILILESDESSKSFTEKNDNNSNSDNQKDKFIKENNSKIEKNSQDSKENKSKELIGSSKRKSVQQAIHFSPKKKDVIEEKTKSRRSSSKKSKEKNDLNNSDDNTQQKLNSSFLLQELSNDEIIEDKPISKHSTHKRQKKKYTTRKCPISPFCDKSELDIFYKKKPKTLIKLRKVSLKNMVIYKPKWTPKYFYEHEMFLQKRKERIINTKKNKQLELESRNYTSFPNINPVLIEIANQTDSYVPIIKRSTEYQNQKIYKAILNEKIKQKEINETMKSKTMYTLDKSKADIVYWRHKLWQKKVEQKLNKNSYKIQKLKEKQILPRNKTATDNKIIYFNTTNNTNTNSNNLKRSKKYNVFERLYKDGEYHEKRIKEITKSYFNQLFKPNIKHSYSFSNKIITKTQPRNNLKVTTYQKIRNRKMNYINNNIKKNKKKTFSIIFEDISMQKNKSRNKKIKNENMTSIESTKPSKNTNNTTRKRLSFEFDNIKNLNTKIIAPLKKEIIPIPIKLGEIKEADSGLSETSTRKKFENKNNSYEINKNKESINNINNTNNNLSHNKSFHSNDINETNHKKEIKEVFNENKTINNSSKEKEDTQRSIKSLLKVKRKSSSSVRPSNFKNLIKQKNANNETDKTTKKDNNIEIKTEVKIIQEPKEIDDININNSPSFNTLQKKEKENIENLVENNNSENLLQESGSFGNINYSNFLTKENISKENQEKEIKRQKSSQRKKSEKKIPKIKETKEMEKETPKNSIKKITNINFDPYEIQKSNESISSEETSSIKEEEDIIQKIRNIEIKEERNKIDKIIQGKNKKNEDKTDVELYMLNWKNTTANSMQEPFTYVDKKGIFYHLFKKN